MELSPGIYQQCPVCDAQGEALEDDLANGLKPFECPACAGLGLILHACPAEDERS